jgi:phosphoribosylanthranilate isomerase
VAEIKFCGLTRVEDARVACELGAGYLGVIFAGGPRLVSADRAREVLAGCTREARRVGVFGRVDPEEIARSVDRARLHVAQLHGDPTAEDVASVRAATGAEIWAVVRVGTTVPTIAGELFDEADAVLVDAKVDGKLGGTGVAVDWSAVAPELRRTRRGRALVLAGGLRPENVADAIATIEPDVVDVSSGVESAPGIKDHARMRAFAAAVSGARQERR